MFRFISLLYSLSLLLFFSFSSFAHSFILTSFILSNSISIWYTTSRTSSIESIKISPNTRNGWQRLVDVHFYDVTRRSPGDQFASFKMKIMTIISSILLCLVVYQQGKQRRFPFFDSIPRIICHLTSMRDAGIFSWWERVPADMRQIASLS